MSITVVLPTRDRSDDFLFKAIEGIKRQTVVGAIERIIVSENGITDASSMVCKAFPELKIDYVKQREPLPFVEHLHWLMNQSSSKYTAMLHDDDWWYPTHLENAIKELENPEVVCYFSNFFFSENEILKKPSFHYSSMLSYIVSSGSAYESILLSFEQIAMLCYLFTPFHMSCMVCKADIMKKVSQDTRNISEAWFVDRILYPFMALHGKLAFQPQPLAAIRLHSGSVTNSIDNQLRIDSHIRGSNYIRELSISKRFSIEDAWQQKKIELSKEEWSEVNNLYNAYLGMATEHKSPFFQPVRPPEPLTIKKALKSVLKRLG